MCGLLGWSLNGKNRPRNRQIAVAAAILAYAMDKRGGDSWGLYLPRKDILTRGLGRLADSFAPMNAAENDCLFAHTRKATTGQITVDNAHPFACKRVVGAHNGMVSNHAELNKLYARTCAVDSHHLFLHLDEDQDFCDVEAYGAVEFVYRDKPDTIYLSRFNDGDLAVYGGKWGCLWASSESCLRAAANLAGLNGGFFKIDDGATYFAKRGILYKTDDVKINPRAYSYYPMGFSRAATRGSSYRGAYSGFDSEYDDDGYSKDERDYLADSYYGGGIDDDGKINMNFHIT